MIIQCVSAGELIKQERRCGSGKSECGVCMGRKKVDGSQAWCLQAAVPAAGFARTHQTPNPSLPPSHPPPSLPPPARRGTRAFTSRGPRVTARTCGGGFLTVRRTKDAAPPLRCAASEVARAGRARRSIACAGGGHVHAGVVRVASPDLGYMKFSSVLPPDTVAKCPFFCPAIRTLVVTSKLHPLSY